VPAAALVAPAPGGRVHRQGARAGLADVAPSGRARLDAIARWLQDAAWGDVEESGVEDDGVWVVRRAHLRVERFPAFGERLEVATFCSGTGPMIAERRSTLRGDAGAHVEAEALWVHLDAVGTRPRPLPAGFEVHYGAAAAGRRVKARLRHAPEPPAGAAPAAPWRFRAADLDLAGHVNNAVYWAVLEEDLAPGDPATPLAAEIEHRAAGATGGAEVLAAGPARWILQAGTVLATAELG
jgi:acyl-ACP thioesterase